MLSEPEVDRYDGASEIDKRQAARTRRVVAVTAHKISRVINPQNMSVERTWHVER